MARVVNTDNFGGDYPDEKFVENLPVLTHAQASLVAAAINSAQGDLLAPRYFKAVADDYKLKPGFEP
jgi:hypothetical protein